MKITISTETALNLMRRNPFDLDIDDQTRTTLANLCNVEQVANVSLPRAIEAVRPHLRKHLNWVAPALDDIESNEAACPCTIDCTDDDQMRKCPVLHTITGWLMLLDGHTWEVPPLPADAYTQSEDEAEEVMNTLKWAVAQAFATETKPITVMLVEEPADDDDTYRWN